ncbi:hypothetical protein IV203_022360 [Nitzschia inconspicua]|uniref:Uncharacterized protein n=1 Tax=Nitzschia inconspicua TaxID=303405 RepID=A0A9K3PE98_9STRA|nr:hypothetical protein IV203_022360 [Nitzschia inconspicua]
MTPDEIAFTNAFNRQRPILTGFAHCSDLNELHVVRDAFFFGLARDLCPEQYSAIANHVVMDEQVAATAHTSQGFQQLLVSARSQKAEWTALVDAVHEKATAVGSDIDGIWKTLEQGRMEWLRAVNAAHPIKQLLKEALHTDGAASSPGDVSDAMMVWIYALCININALLPAADKWATMVGMPERRNPLKGYQAEKWDPRKEEWKLLDVGAQEAAERGGTTLQTAWDA